VGWTWRILWHRSLAQRALLLPVLAVAVVGATLLGTFLLLLTSSEHRALDVGLERASVDDRQLDARYTLADVTRGPAVLAHASAAIDDLLGGVRADRTAWLSSQMYDVEGTTDAQPPYVYLASYPTASGSTKVITGTLPTTATDTAGNIEAAVPKAAADAYGWHVGSVIHVRDATALTPTTFVVTGTFELAGVPSLWTRDVLGGATHDPSYPVIGSLGVTKTKAWGPLIVAPDTFTSGKATLIRADLVTLPHFDGATPEQIGTLREQIASARAALSAATSAEYASAVVSTRLQDTIDTAVGALQVTRVGLVIVGLMLVAVAITVLLLAARLLAERRASEQTFMASRGATSRQIFTVAALESFAIAILTAAVAPWSAAFLFWAITGAGPFARAGLHQDPGRPRALWVACAAVSLVLAGVLLAPVLQRHGSAVDAEQQLVRQHRRGGMARRGADIALVVVAGLALFQLRSYHSPVVQGVGDLGSLDPVLVAAPALVLLAGAIVALRLVPLVGRLGERLAARSRSLVGPLAAWQVGRRPGRATGAVLLLTLVVGVGVFAQSFLATWRGSQNDQADLAVGTDVRVVPTAETPLQASAALGAEPAVRRASPVIDREVSIGTASGGRGTVQTTLLGVDARHADDVLRGRTDEPTWAAETKKLVTTSSLVGTPLPGTPTHLVLDVTSSTFPQLTGTVLVTLVLQDGDGARTSVPLEAVPASGATRDLVVPLPAMEAGTRLVGVKTVLVPGEADNSRLADAVGDLSLRVTVGHLRVVSAGGVQPGTDAPAKVGDIDAGHIAPVTFGGVPWTAAGLPGQNSSPSDATVDAQGDALAVSDAIAPSRAILGGQGFTAVSTESTPAQRRLAVPVLATPGMLSSIDGEVGDQLTVDIGTDGAPVDVVVVGKVDRLPGEPTSDGILADTGAISRATLLGGGTRVLADQWWLSVTDSKAEAVAEHVTTTDVGTATARVSVRTEATSGPLHVGIEAALWIVIVAAIGLAVAGLALSATVSVRTRRLELARLQAVGASRGGLVGSVLTEYAVVGTLGVAVGLVLGALLGREITPLITVSASGAPPVPPVLVHWAWGSQGRLLALLVALVAVTVATTANTLLRRASGELLRLGDER
jgi:hypothetical protein